MGLSIAFIVISLALNPIGSSASERPIRFLCVFDRHVSPETGRVSRSNPLRYEFVVDGTGHAFAVGRNVYPVQAIKRVSRASDQRRPRDHISGSSENRRGADHYHSQDRKRRA